MGGLSDHVNDNFEDGKGENSVHTFWCEQH